MEFKRYFTTIDAHAGGQPLRIITGGLPVIKGESILERSVYFKQYLDDIRRVLMYEPRGHHGMYGCVIIPPVSPEASFGVLFMHNEGFSTMCGHGIIAVVTVAIETGLIADNRDRPEIIIDSAAGKITAYAECSGSTVRSVSFINVPSFVLAEDIPVTVGHRKLKAAVAFGGAFYAVVKASDLDLNVDIAHLPDLQKAATAIKTQVERQVKVVHPLEKELQGVYGVIFTDLPKKNDSHARNVTIFADEQIDRSPCGTGTCARLALLFHNGQLSTGEQFVHESIVGSQFGATIMDVTNVGTYQAIIPRIKGRAFITGTHQYIVDPSDPLREGFLLR